MILRSFNGGRRLNRTREQGTARCANSYHVKSAASQKRTMDAGIRGIEADVGACRVVPPLVAISTVLHTLVWGASSRAWEEEWSTV